MKIDNRLFNLSKKNANVHMTQEESTVLLSFLRHHTGQLSTWSAVNEFGHEQLAKVVTKIQKTNQEQTENSIKYLNLTFDVNDVFNRWMNHISPKGFKTVND
jgi:hypothetical protein